MYTLIAVYVHFNHFIDLTINSNATPYNLASSKLFLVWDPCLKTYIGYKQWSSLVAVSKLSRELVFSYFSTRHADQNSLSLERRLMLLTD